jgi:hypothetical protein
LPNPSARNAQADGVRDVNADQGSGGAPAGTAAARVGNALVHLTIALYRALAAEIAEGFAAHAAAAQGTDAARMDKRELAAQLALELDGAPDPAMLREVWRRSGRLRDGVLWPEATQKTLHANLITDQGMRELVAVSTAAQAFRICIGDVTESEKKKNFDRREGKTSTGVDVNELANRLGAIGAGALAGGVVGAETGALPGVGAGLFVWLLSGITLAWSGSRTRESDRTIDYNFMRDRSVQTLDRDLPLVIDRIRQAGLAPVFVIDELDKLDDADRKIADIIDRMKHLVADYGFFCFLSGRDYFDRIEQKVVDEAYPTEHTYFSARLLVLNRPQDLFDYLYGLIEEDEADIAHPLRASVFALFVLYRSRLNFTDAARELARWCDEENVVGIPDSALQTAGRFRLAATVQIAIDFILSADAVADRLDAEPIFAQQAIDALYMVPRLLQKDSDATIDISEAAIEHELQGRMRGRLRERGNPPPAGDQGAAPEISKPNLRALKELIDRLVSYLSSFETLKQELQNEAARTPEPAKAAALGLRSDIVVAEMQRLVQSAGPAEPGKLRFVRNELGQPLPSATRSNAGRAAPRAGDAAPEPDGGAPRGRP